MAPSTWNKVIFPLISIIHKITFFDLKSIKKSLQVIHTLYRREKVTERLYEKLWQSNPHCSRGQKTNILHLLRRDSEWLQGMCSSTCMCMCPHPCLALEVDHCQHSCGCRKDRETGKHLGHPLGHQCPPRCCSGYDSQSQQGHPTFMGYFPCFLGEQGDMAYPCTIPAVLHHKSQLACTKRC